MNSFSRGEHPEIFSSSGIVRRVHCVCLHTFRKDLAASTPKALHSSSAARKA